MTYEQAKDHVAKKLGYKSYEDYNSELLVTINRHDFNREVVRQYATEKVKEALRLAAERATLKIERDSKQVLKGNYAYFANDMDHVEVNKESILSLQSELVNNIINEI